MSRDWNRWQVFYMRKNLGKGVWEVEVGFVSSEKGDERRGGFGRSYGHCGGASF